MMGYCLRLPGFGRGWQVVCGCQGSRPQPCRSGLPVGQYRWARILLRHTLPNSCFDWSFCGRNFLGDRLQPCPARHQPTTSPTPALPAEVSPQEVWQEMEGTEPPPVAQAPRPSGAAPSPYPRQNFTPNLDLPTSAIPAINPRKVLTVPLSDHYD